MMSSFFDNHIVVFRFCALISLSQALPRNDFMVRAEENIVNRSFADVGRVVVAQRFFRKGDLAFLTGHIFICGYT